MLILYHSIGAGDYDLQKEPLSDEQWERVKQTTCRLLRARKSHKAASLLEEIPFRLYEAQNRFGDEFTVLFAVVPFDAYLELSEHYTEPLTKASARILSEVFNETHSYFIRFIVVGLDNNPAPAQVVSPALQITSEAVERALADAEQLLRTRDAISAVDRVHTVFHGYLRAVVIRMGTEPEKDASATQLFKTIRETHPAFIGSQSEEVHKILRATAVILDALGPIRNRESIAHPNENMIAEPEAQLIINAVRTLLHYLNAKIGEG
jgi:HEPN domain-containing protein